MNDELAEALEFLHTPAPGQRLAGYNPGGFSGVDHKPNTNFATHLVEVVEIFRDYTVVIVHTNGKIEHVAWSTVRVGWIGSDPKWLTE